MNFKHLHYFWVAAKAGGILRAGEQLHTTPQTLSGQIKLLEDRLGRPLFRKSGRNLELTDQECLSQHKQGGMLLGTALAPSNIRPSEDFAKALAVGAIVPPDHVP